ncbi:hypothetical protein A8525_25970 [Escherichia coli]|nr:hypothetical protein [Escherichia coli]EFB3662034.1 hypothetical protein [Escherichia coli]EFB7407348.1 hypothetical protein [Escherichia coli]EFK2968244.1 hypothetical protein [Escherichia coli]
MSPVRPYLSNNILNIKSFDKIQSENIQTHKNTYSEDIKEISNHDFVFLGLKFPIIKKNSH